MCVLAHTQVDGQVTRSLRPPNPPDGDSYSYILGFSPSQVSVIGTYTEAVPCEQSGGPMVDLSTKLLEVADWVTNGTLTLT